MSFGEAVRSGFRNWSRLDGRALRSEYWWWILFLFIASLGATMVIAAIDAIVARAIPGLAGLFGVLVLIAALIAFVATLTVSVRRLHDTNRSGWWWFLNFIPYIGGFILVVIYCFDGTSGPNRFGDRPGGNPTAYRPALPPAPVPNELR